jgi:hypothetical protein
MENDRGILTRLREIFPNDVKMNGAWIDIGPEEWGV